ncbi:MAG: FecR domain-containing protein [Bacteroidota bacterium]
MTASSHPGPSHSLPASVEAALREVPHEERPRLREAWTQASALAHTEPTEATLRDLGTQIWSRLDAQTAPAAPRQAAARPPVAPSRTLMRRFQRSLTAVTAVAVLVALGTALYMQPVSIEAGEQVVVTALPDGSMVHLNSSSRLTYTRSFGADVRLVHLEGEGFFDVTPDNVPFQVQTFNAKVRVLGTAFNVRAWEDERSPATEVTVDHGQVSLSPISGSAPGTLLAAGQGALVRSGADLPETLATVDTDEVFDWRDGEMHFVDEPLDRILRDVERRFDVTVKTTPPSLQFDTLTYLKRDPANAAEVLEDLAELKGYALTSTPHGFRLSRPASSN